VEEAGGRGDEFKFATEKEVRKNIFF